MKVYGILSVRKDTRNINGGCQSKLGNGSYHRRENVGQGSCELEHDHHNRDGDVHDSAKSCSSTEKSIGSGCNTGNIGLTGSEEAGVRKGFMESFDEDSNHPSERRSDSHGWDKDTCRYFATIRDDDEEGPHYRGKCQGEHHGPSILCPESPLVSSRSQKSTRTHSHNPS